MMKQDKLLIQFSVVLILFSGVQTIQNGTEVNSGIILKGAWDYLSYGRGYSRCTEMVERATEFGNSRINFVPTQFWVDQGQTDTVDYYCFKTGGGICESFTWEHVRIFREDMKLCFAKAVSNGLSIAISPHLDDGLELNGWRNALRFDPYERHGGFSYYDIMLAPLADALNAVINPSTKVWFNMQGEMGATLMFYPRSYTYLVTELKYWIRYGRESEIPASNIKIGLGFNFNKLCGCVLVFQGDVDGYLDPLNYLKKFPEAIQPYFDRGEFDIPSLQELFATADSYAISNYAALLPDFYVTELQSALWQFDQELRYFNVSIRDLTLNQGKEMNFVEYGVGGGTDRFGGDLATTAAEVAITPFFGIYGAYTQALDPWQLYSDDPMPETRQYLHYYFNQTAEFFKITRPVSFDDNANLYRTEYVYRIDGVYLWNQGSWDIQAIYPSSTSAEGSYRDEIVIDLIKRHNAAVQAQNGIILG